MMTDKDKKNLLELFESLRHIEVSPEIALKELISAGIMDENGDYTPPYQQLLDEDMGKE